MVNEKLKSQERIAFIANRIPILRDFNIDYNIKIFHLSIKILFLKTFYLQSFLLVLSFGNRFWGYIDIWRKNHFFSYFLYFGDSFGKVVGAKSISSESHTLYFLHFGEAIGDALKSSKKIEFNSNIFSILNITYV